MDHVSNIYITNFSLGHTPYAGGVFRCKLVIDNEFP
jgi:ubiquitin-protein ligase